MIAAILVEVSTRHRRRQALELRRTANLFEAVRPPAPAIFVILQQYHTYRSKSANPYVVCTIVKPGYLTAPLLSIRTSFFRMTHTWNCYQERR